MSCDSHCPNCPDGTSCPVVHIWILQYLASKTHILTQKYVRKKYSKLIGKKLRISCKWTSLNKTLGQFQNPVNFIWDMCYVLDVMPVGTSFHFKYMCLFLLFNFSWLCISRTEYLSQHVANNVFGRAAFIWYKDAITFYTDAVDCSVTFWYLCST